MHPQPEPTNKLAAVNRSQADAIAQTKVSPTKVTQHRHNHNHNHKHDHNHKSCINSTTNNLSSSLKRLSTRQMISLLLAVGCATSLGLCGPSPNQPFSGPRHPNPSPQQHPEAPVIARFEFGSEVHENQRASVLCTVTSGETPYAISWLKDGHLLTGEAAPKRGVQIRPDHEQSNLYVSKVRLEHSGNYTCVARNRHGSAAHSAALQVLAEPRWLREPPAEPIVATSGQTVVVECSAAGWPRPQLTWSIKTHSRSQFEPLAATGRISLAANGSLVIRNADKSDEANYMCKASNGIGRDISLSSSLKVNVPAHFEAAQKLQSQLVRRQHQVQLRCDAHGDEPITIDWYKNRQLLQLPAEPAPPLAAHGGYQQQQHPQQARGVASALPLPADPRYSVISKPMENGLISLLVIKQANRNDNGHFECVTRNQVGRDKLTIELAVQEEPDPIQELQASQPTARSVALVWSEPYDGRSPIHTYAFEYKRAPVAAGSGAGSGSPPDALLGELADSSGLVLEQPLQQHDDWAQATKVSFAVPVASQQASNQTAGSGPVRQFTIERLEPATKYLLRAAAINAMGSSRWSQTLEFSSDEEAPELAPSGVRCRALNSTAIEVSWQDMAWTLHSHHQHHPNHHQHQHQHRHHQHHHQHQNQHPQRQKIHGYYVGYRVANSSFVHKPFIVDPAWAASGPSTSGEPGRLEMSVGELRRDTQYELSVVAFNSRGSGPSSELVACRTVEMEAPKPVKLQVRHESNDTIHIEWQRDPSDLQNPIDDYELYLLKNSVRSNEAPVRLQVRLPGNQTQYRTSNLKCGTRYQFYVTAQNKIGKSAPSEHVSASTSGSAPDVPAKQSLINMLNSSCLQINLNAFQDKGCRIKTYTLRYKLERLHLPPGAPRQPHHHQLQQQQAATSASASASAAANPNASATEWINVGQANSGMAPNSRSIGARQGAEGADDMVEHLCELSPIGEYTIHVTATNDVGRSEAEYSVLMSSDELRYSLVRDLLAPLAARLPQVSSVLVFMLAGLFAALAALAVYATSASYYQKLVIMRNQRRATRRAKADERRRRKLAGSRMSQAADWWAEDYDPDDSGDSDNDRARPRGGRRAQAPASGAARDSDDELASDEDTQTVDYDVNVALNGTGSCDDDDAGSSGNQLELGVDLHSDMDIGLDAANAASGPRNSSRKQRHSRRQHQQLAAAKSRRHERDYRKPPPMHHFRSNSNPRNLMDMSSMSMMMAQQHQQQQHQAHLQQQQRLHNHLIRHQQQQDNTDTDGGVSSDAHTCSTLGSNSNASNSRNQMARLSRQTQLANSTPSAARLNNSNPIYGTAATAAANTSAGHYMANLSVANFDSSSMDSQCNRQSLLAAASGKPFAATGGSCGISTASTDSAGSRRFQCLSSKQFVKMNEYSMLPTVSASLQQQRPAVDIYGTLGASRTQTISSGLQNSSSVQQQQQQSAYSTLRRTSMQTYVPSTQQRQRQPSNPIYGYYVAPKMDTAADLLSENPNSNLQRQQQQPRDELAANSIFVPPQQQMIYGTANMRIKQAPVFL